jgi:hypothetical protein
VLVATSAWNETATWASQPTFGASPIASSVISAINQWISLDITAQVDAWLADPASNFGLVLVQDAPASTGGTVAVVYESSSSVNKPYLQIIPEPASLGWVGLSLLTLRRRRTK